MYGCFMTRPLPHRRWPSLGYAGPDKSGTSVGTSCCDLVYKLPWTADPRRLTMTRPLLEWCYSWLLVRLLHGTPPSLLLHGRNSGRVRHLDTSVDQLAERSRSSRRTTAFVEANVEGEDQSGTMASLRAGNSSPEPAQPAGMAQEDPRPCNFDQPLGTQQLEFLAGRLSARSNHLRQVPKR